MNYPYGDAQQAPYWHGMQWPLQMLLEKTAAMYPSPAWELAFFAPGFVETLRWSV